jgi:phenylpyruvate tautomerase PptA (4-oxalocrotonate tautomerase family)
MPLLTVYTSAPPLPADKGQDLLKKLSASATEILGKPERYFMTCLVAGMPMTFGGTTEPACAVEVKSIGALAGDRAKRLSEAVCSLVHQGTGVAKDRIFLVCTDVPAALWGFNGSTFGS